MPISNLKKQKCYIEVDVKEDNPIIEGIYPVITKHADTPSIREFTNGAFVNYDGYAVTHWLHPLENRYILTEEELSELIRNSYRAGEKYGKSSVGEYYGGPENENPNCSQYIKSLNL
jgi:hypothetical protein